MIITSLRVLKDYNSLRRNKKGALEMDELGKLILGLILFIILIYIVSIIIGGEIGAQKDDVTDVFSSIG
jgi:hypothetical protein